MKDDDIRQNVASIGVCIFVIWLVLVVGCGNPRNNTWEPGEAWHGTESWYAEHPEVPRPRDDNLFGSGDYGTPWWEEARNNPIQNP